MILNLNCLIITESFLLKINIKRCTMKNKSRNIKKALAFTCALIQALLLFSISLAAYSTDDADGSSVASASSDYS